MSKIPTAEEFCKEFRKLNPIAQAESIEHWMGQHCIEFTKLHVKAALEEINKSIDALDKRTLDIDETGCPVRGAEYNLVLDSDIRNSISKAYPLENIK